MGAEFGADGWQSMSASFERIDCCAYDAKSHFKSAA
jgi:hypothetical protein